MIGGRDAKSQRNYSSTHAEMEKTTFYGYKRPGGLVSKLVYSVSVRPQAQTNWCFGNTKQLPVAEKKTRL